MAESTATATARENDRSTPYYNMEMGGMAADPNVPPDEDDDDDDDVSVAPSIVSTVLTAEGIHDPVGFNIVCLVILVGDMARGVMFPTLYPLIQELGGSEITAGFAVSAFSFGRILVSPYFGSCSIQYGYSKTLLGSCSLLLVGALLYSQILNVGSVQFLILSQIVLGIGSGTLGVTRAFVAEVTAQRNRTTYMAWITAVQYGGFTVTPFVGASLSWMLQENEFGFGPFRLNKYTAPAYFMSVVIIFVIFMLFTRFKDRQRMQTTKKKTKTGVRVDDHSSQKTWIGLTVYDCCILGCMLLNVATKGSISSFETLGIKIAADVFNMESSEAGAVVATCGTVGVIFLLFMGYLATILDDIQLICGGMLVMVTGVLGLSLVGNGNGDGADWKFAAVIFLIYSVGYPIGHTAVIGLFSKIVGRRPQGTLLGWFASAGSLARMTFPIMSGLVSKYVSLAALLYILAAILLVSTGFTLSARKTLKLLSQ